MKYRNDSPSEIAPATIRLVAQCLTQLSYRVHNIMWNGTALHLYSSSCLCLSNRPTIDHFRAVVSQKFDSQCYIDADIRSVAPVSCRSARRLTFAPSSARTAQRTQTVSVVQTNNGRCWNVRRQMPGISVRFELVLNLVSTQNRSSRKCF